MKPFHIEIEREKNKIQVTDIPRFAHDVCRLVEATSLHSLWEENENKSHSMWIQWTFYISHFILFPLSFMHTNRCSTFDDVHRIERMDCMLNKVWVLIEISMTRNPTLWKFIVFFSFHICWSKLSSFVIR